MKILITGCAGYIGSKLTTILLEIGHEVIGVDNLYFNQSSICHLAMYKNFKFYNMDVCGREFIPLLDKENFDVIFPLAALVGAKLCEAYPKEASNLNYGQIQTIIDWKLANNSKVRIIYPNTNSGYGVGGGDFCTEESPLQPISTYGITKCTAENYLTSKCPEDSTVFRLATVFGPSYRFRQDLLVNDFVARAYFDKFIVLFESGFRRNYIFIDDVVEAFIWAMKNNINGVYNLGLSSANLTKMELCLKIKEQIPDFVIKEDEFAKDPDKRDYIVSNDKIEKAGFITTHSLEEGIEQLIRFYKMLPRREFCNI
jgi:nucleoside-diphosphate-sugar epimerase